MSAFGGRRTALLARTDIDAVDLPAALSDLTDEWLIERFTSEVKASGRSDIEGVALVAVGGYGRSELCPGSDIDLLLLHDEVDTGDLADRLWYPIWDEKLKLGHAVRSAEQALELAASDIDTATALSSARHLAGDAGLTERLLAGVSDDWQINAAQRLDQLERAVSRRHHLGGEVAFLLEPDLKTGRGGLRDVHAIGWAALAGVELRLADQERLAEAYQTLLRARVELHRTTGLRSDFLSADDQDAVAKRYGIVDAEPFMADIARAGRVVAFLSDQVWSRAVRLAAASSADAPLDDISVDISGLSVHDGELVIDGDPAPDVVLGLHAAVQSARNKIPLSRSSLAKLAERQPQFPEPWPHGARDLFIELLGCGHRAIGVIESLDFFDVWTRLLPEWAPNRSRPQRSRYHRFTVDRHLLEAVAEAARFTHRVSRPDLLLMGALLHDIGKGYPGDHTEAGMRLAGPIARRCGWNATDADTLVRLVQHHLLLTDVATRRDLGDPLTVTTVARATGTPEFLELLAVMTEADCTATGPMAWGDWTASLVSTLVSMTAEHLSGSDPAPTRHRRLLTDEVVELMAAEETALRADGDMLTVVAPDERGLFSRAAGVLAHAPTRAS